MGNASPKHSWRGKLLWAVLIAFVLGAGWVFAGGKWHKDTREAWPETETTGDADPSAVMVTVEPVMHRPIQRTVEGVGTLHGFEEVMISARVEGRVRKLHHDVADRVKPGQLLLEIDPTDYELAVQQAEGALQVELARLGFQELPAGKVDLSKVPSVMQAHARMENARTRHDRTRRLAATRAIAAEDQETAASDDRAASSEYANQLLVARSALATVRLKQTGLAVARQQLKDARIFAPTPSLPVPGADTVSYAITQRSVSEGTLVRPGTELFKLVIAQTLKLRLPVPERFAADVQLGQNAAVSMAAFPRPFPGAVTRINPAVDPLTRTFEVEIQVRNSKGQLKPGSFARAAILTSLDAEAVAVPLSALVQFAGITKIFLAENGRAKEVPVTLGVQTTDWVEIVRPALPRGARVITSGQTMIANDTPVSVRSSAPAAPRVVSRDTP